MPALLAVLGSLIGGIVSSIGKMLSVETIKFIAYRALAIFFVF